MFDVAAEELRFLDGELPELVAGSHAGHASGNAGQDRTAQFALILGRGLLAAFLGAIAVRGFLWGDLHWLGPGRGLPRLGLLEIATAAASPTLGSNLGATRRSWRGKKLPEVAVRHRGRRGGATAGALGLGRRGRGLANSGASGLEPSSTPMVDARSSPHDARSEGRGFLSRVRASRASKRVCEGASANSLVCAERCEADLVEAPGEQCRSLTTMCGFDHTRVWRVCFSMNLWKFDQSRTAKSARERLRLRERSQASKSQVSCGGSGESRRLSRAAAHSDARVCTYHFASRRTRASKLQRPSSEATAKALARRRQAARARHGIG